MKAKTPEELAAQAVGGDAHALDALLRRIKDDVYGLAMRMLAHPADAEDATQEVLLRVVTRLSTFEGRSSLRTWVYRLAVRAILNFRRGRYEAPPLTFEAFGEELLHGLGCGAPEHLEASERQVLEKEIRIACTQAMLMCLDRDHRIAYLLGVILELDGETVADWLQIESAAYRKRLSRARSRVEGFMRSHCGLVEAAAPCSCAGRIEPALASGCVDPDRLLFARHPARALGSSDAHAVAEVLGELKRSDEVMRSNPQYVAPERLLQRIRAARG